MTISTQLILTRLALPTDVLYLIKDYLFHVIKKIDKQDERYTLLMNILPKEVDVDTNGVVITVATLKIKDDKYYFLTYNNIKYMLELFVYRSDNTVIVYEETAQSRKQTDWFYRPLN